MDEIRYRPVADAGLTAGQVRARQAEGKQNLPPEPFTKTTGQIIRENVCTLFNLFNVLIALALASVGAWSNMLFILIIALNTLIGIVQELHAKRLVDRLSLLSMPSARVIRDGAAAEIPVEEVVLEDVIELEAGRQVCADAVILTGQVEVDESLLTGESDPVHRAAGDKLLSGNFVTSGRCRACVQQVGAGSYAARIAGEARQLQGARSRLLGAMRRVTWFTGFLIPPLGCLLYAEAVLLRGEAAGPAVVSTAAALLGMLPKGLVLLTSVSLAVGIAALSRRRVLVQQLYALESLAYVDTLCLDKTGTLTLGRLQVEEVHLADPAQADRFARLMGSFLACAEDSNATFQALQGYFGADGVFPPAGSVPFSSERKWSAVDFGPEGVFVVGAPERLGGVLSPGLRQAEAQGKRVLMAGLAQGPAAAGSPLPPVHPLAYIVLADQLRPSAAGTLAYFREEGVDLKLISGDNPVTAAALAAQAGFPHADRYIDMSSLTTEAEVERAAREYAVFGRVSPAQKKQLVQALQKAGRTVAMTGDGVNDLLALRQADCSIAMASGSDAARQVAQVVLLDSDFGALPHVLAQWRRVVNNVTRVAGVFFVKTIYSALLAAACIFLNLPFPFVPIQITLIDLVIEGYPAFFTSFEPDGRKVTGRFLPTVLRRALPNALSILVCFVLLLGISPLFPLPAGQYAALFYLLVGTVGIQAVLNSSWPFDKLRVFLCATMTAGFYTAVFLFHHLLQVALPSGAALGLFVLFGLLSFLVERGLALLLRPRQAPAPAKEALDG